MTIDLGPDLERLVQEKVQTRRYNSAADVIREALQLLEERDQNMALHKNEIHSKIAEGLESLRLGKGVEGEAVFERIDRELDRLEPPER